MHQPSAPRHPGTPAPRHPGTPAPLNHRRPSTFSAACLGCERTLLGFLATLSAGLPTVFAVTVVLLSAVLPVAEAQTVVRGPYLQSGTSSSVIIKWRTDEATDSLVRYGLDHDPDGLQLSATNSTSTTEHAVQLTGLSADVKYFYSVGTSSALQLAGGDSDHFVVTAPVPGTAKPTRIWVIGDSGTAKRNARAVRDAFLNFTESRNPDLWIMLGDNAYYHGTDNEYQRAVFNTYSQVLPRTVLWPTLGNHGKGTSDSTTESGPYYDIFSLPRNGEAGGVASGTEAYYSFDYGNIHFVCLNSETDPSPDGAMMTWLEADLAANDKEWIIAFWHRPPYSRGSANSDTDSRQIALRQNAVPLLERYGVDLVLTGHTHAYERSYLIDGHYGLSDTFTDAMKKNSGDGSATGDGAYQKPATVGAPHAGAVYVVAGTAGVIKTGGSLDHPAMAVSIRTLGSMVLDVNGNRLDAKFLGSTGDIWDDFTILKLPEAPNTAPSFTPNTAPSFTPGTAAFTVAENQTAAGTVQAADGDSADEVTGYAFEGALEDGADQSHFSLGSTSGVLTFQTPPNFEAPQDADTNNTYVVVVRATSGTGTRLKTADQTVTVTVTDVNTEAPGVPSALTFSGETRDSLTVRWTEPENTGPPITDYDVQYHTGSDAYREWTHEGPGRTATITGLDLGTAYEVQVRASNEEGRSDWSEPGEGTTIAPLRVQMTLDPEPPVEGAFKARFSFSETVTGFTLGDIATQQDADCRNENNDQVACNPPTNDYQWPKL